MKHNIEYTHKNIKLAPIQLNDIEQLRHWRNDKSLTKGLAEIDYITKEKQEAWYQKDLEDKDCYSFGIYETEELNEIIGSVALYNFDEKCAECGRLFLGNINVRGKGYGHLATVLCVQIAFDELDLDEVIAYVFEDNIAALTSNKKLGFKVIEKDDKNEFKIKVTKEEFWNINSFLYKKS